MDASRAGAIINSKVWIGKIIAVIIPRTILWVFAVLTAKRLYVGVPQRAPQESSNVAT